MRKAFITVSLLAAFAAGSASRADTQSQLSTTIAKGIDLELTLYSLPDSPQVGDTVDVTAHVENVGDADSKTCNLSFKQGNRYLDPIYTLPPVKPGRHFEITIPKTLDIAGTYVMGAELRGCIEGNRANNTARLRITPRAPDLVITRWEARQYKVGLRQPVKIRVWIKNIGDADSGRFIVDAFFEPCETIAQGRRWARVDGLPQDEEVARDISHQFNCIGHKNLDRLEVDKDNEVVESNERNNVENTYRIFEVGMPWH